MQSSRVACENLNTCIVVIAGGGYYCCCYYRAAGRPRRCATQAEWKVNLQPGRVLQARAKAEEQSLAGGCGWTEMTPSILGNSFSEKRNEPLDFICHGMARGTILPLGFSTGQVNMVILVVGTATPGTPQSRVSVCSSRAYGRRGLL